MAVLGETYNLPSVLQYGKNLFKYHLISFMSFQDNPFSAALARVDKAGEDRVPATSQDVMVYTRICA